MPNSWIEDPKLRAIVDIVQTEYTGAASGATAVVDGALTVLRVAPGSEPDPAAAGFAIVEAINAALDQARAAAKHLVPDPSVFDDDGEVGHPGAEEPMEEFEGASDDGRVVAKASATTQRVTSFYMEDLSDDVVSQVPVAVNRALAKAFQGDPDATALGEEFDAIEDEFAEAMRAIQAEVDAIGSRHGIRKDGN